MDIRHLLFATDFSSHATQALRFALHLFAHSLEKVSMLHVFEPPYDFSMRLSERFHAEEQKAQKAMQQLLQELNLGKEGVMFQTIVIPGKVSSSILEAASQLKVDCVVMGTQGRRSIKNRLLGSTTVDLLSLSDCPLLAIPDTAHVGQLDHLFYATAYREGDVVVIEQLARLVAAHQATFHVLHVESSGDFEKGLLFRGFRELVSEQLPAVAIKHEYLVHQDAVEGILQYTKEYTHGLLAISYYRRGFWQSLFYQSKAEQLLQLSHVPILALSR